MQQDRYTLRYRQSAVQRPGDFWYKGLGKMEEESVKNEQELRVWIETIKEDETITMAIYIDNVSKKPTTIK